MKKLKSLHIVFTTMDEMLEGIESALRGEESEIDYNESLAYDSIETFKRQLTPNRLELLRAIARLKPSSINQLAKMVNREFPHVLKDCRSLEFYGFIVLEEMDGARKQLKPRLAFDYDVIRVHSKLEEMFLITEESNRVLARSMIS